MTIIIFILFVLLWEYSNTMKLITEINSVEILYIEHVIRSENKPDTLCGLRYEIKLALCNMYLIKNTRNTFGKQIFFNRTAAQRLSSDCIENTIHFLHHLELNIYEIKQNMFPCYGRHDPMRTDWDIDDNFDYLYISGGPENNSIFVYKHMKMVGLASYNFKEAIIGFDINELYQLKIHQIDVNAELATLNQISATKNQNEIEIIYDREVLSSKRKISNEIFSLAEMKKLSLCRRVFDLLDLQKAWHIDEASFQEFSLKYEKNKVIFEYDNRIIQQAMFPCYAKDLNDTINGKRKFVIKKTWYLSAGPRKKSIILYKKVKDNRFTLFAFVENINVEDIEPAVMTNFKEIGKTSRRLLLKKLIGLS